MPGPAYPDLPDKAWSASLYRQVWPTWPGLPRMACLAWTASSSLPGLDCLVWPAWEGLVCLPGLPGVAYQAYMA